MLQKSFLCYYNVHYSIPTIKFFKTSSSFKISQTKSKLSYSWLVSVRNANIVTMAETSLQKRLLHRIDVDPIAPNRY